MVAGLSPARPMRENSCQDETFPAVAAGHCDTLIKEIFMQWTTPTASDFRFGFEITMYVAAR